MTKPIVLISEPLARPATDWLAQRCNIIQLAPKESGFDHALTKVQGLIVRTYTQVDKALLDQADHIRVVGRAGVGLDNIDIDACTDRGIRVVHTPHANAMAVVEYTVSMLMQVLRPIHRLDRRTDTDDWNKIRGSAITPRSVVGARLGIIGFGHIGSRVARAAAALGMQVVYTDLKPIPADQRHGARPVPFEQLFGECDVVCVQVDGRQQNKHIINHDSFAAMRSDVVFVNASRGFVVDEQAAARFADAHPDATLILDVHDPEPINPDSMLFAAKNVILTPHIAAGTKEAKLAMSWVVRDVWAQIDGHEPLNPAN